MIYWDQRCRRQLRDIWHIGILSIIKLGNATRHDWISGDPIQKITQIMLTDLLNGCLCVREKKILEIFNDRVLFLA